MNKAFAPGVFLVNYVLISPCATSLESLCFNVASVSTTWPISTTHGDGKGLFLDLQDLLDLTELAATFVLCRREMLARWLSAERWPVPATTAATRQTTACSARAQHSAEQVQSRTTIRQSHEGPACLHINSGSPFSGQHPLVTSPLSKLATPKPTYTLISFSVSRYPPGVPHTTCCHLSVFPAVSLRRALPVDDLS
jgi:hypothetical protein